MRIKYWIQIPSKTDQSNLQNKSDRNPPLTAALLMNKLVVTIAIRCPTFFFKLPGYYLCECSRFIYLGTWITSRKVKILISTGKRLDYRCWFVNPWFTKTDPNGRTDSPNGPAGLSVHGRYRCAKIWLSTSADRSLSSPSLRLRTPIRYLAAGFRRLIDSITKPLEFRHPGLPHAGQVRTNVRLSSTHRTGIDVPPYKCRL